MNQNRRIMAALALGGTLLGSAAVFGVVPRMRQREALDRTQQGARAPRLVQVAVVQRAALQTESTLPGTTAPFQSTALYARASGFLRRNLVDVGDAVKAGQLLAEIDSPETDEEMRLAQARLEEAQANVGIVERTARRSHDLAGVGVVSAQQEDDTRAQANTALASVKSRQADLQRLNAVRGYQRVIAPFDGIVTRRGADRGALVGPGGGGGMALFEVAAVGKLRVFVDVPQWLAREIRPGQRAIVYAPSEPARTVTGQVARTAGVLDQATRTLRTEVDIPGDGTVLPGAFVYIRFSVARAAPPLLIPAGALIVRKEGTLVARVEGGRIRLLPVQIGRDLGKELELAGGAAAGDVVVLNPPDELEDGQAVRTTPPAGSAAAHAS